MGNHQKPLDPPQDVESDEFAVEMIRGWIAKGNLCSALNLGHWYRHSEIDERSAWGVLLADLTRQLATSLEDVTGDEPADSLKVIVEAFIAELSQSPEANDMAVDGDRGDLALEETTDNEPALPVEPVRSTQENTSAIPFFGELTDEEE